MMKVNGNSGNFLYDSAFWTNASPLNPSNGYQGGVVDTTIEYKYDLWFIRF